MGKSFEMSFVLPGTEEKIQIRGEFSADEWSRLLDFARYAEEVEQTAFFQNGAQISVDLAWDWKNGFSDNSSLPSRPVVAEFVHSLRPIILQKEPTYFLRVCNIISKKSDHAYPRELLNRLRQHFSANPSQAGWTLSIEDLVLNSDEALDLWLNAYEYHRDAEKRTELEQAHGGPPGELSKALFLILLLNKAEAGLALAGMIRAMEKGGGEEFTIRF